MRCSSCSHENPATAKFCQECGIALRTACAGCGTELPPTARFCHDCGRRTAQPASDTAEAHIPQATPTPRSFAKGRYTIERMIGEGARKRVHLARDTRLERDVALMLIKAEGLDEAGRVRVSREAQAMARLGDHPNIGTVHDIGDEDGQLYIIAEYMAGGDLEHHLQRSGEARQLPIQEAVRVASELCSALEHAHGKGVVHRDVKPGNIWLGSDGSVKLGDFGLAVSVDRTRLTHEGMMVGTAAYMSPEQAMGRAPDARSDLYALGATLYEILTGRPPFIGDDAVAIISQHIHTPPVAPTWHNADIPERLEALVLELLEKDSLKRPASAALVRERLTHATSASAERERPEEPATANPLDRLASGVFVGRDEELAALRAGVDQALGGRGRVLLLVGEPGIGKTRTSEELTTYARLRGAQVLWGNCYEGDGAPAYWPWMQIIRSHVTKREPKVLATEMGSGAADIADIVSEVRDRLPGLPTPAKLNPDQARFRLFDSVTSFLRNVSNETPLVLVLDDLHWADGPSLLLLQFLAREFGDSRILVLGTYRDVEVGRHHPLEKTLAELARSERVDRVLLRGLAEDDVARFLELSAGRTPPARLVEAVYRETEGNPFFVHEVVRLLQSDGRLDNPEAVASWSVEIPQGVRQVIGRRLDGLSPDCNQVLTIASVIGREFELRVLARAADRSEDETLEFLEEAEDLRVLAPLDGMPGSFRFSHALVRETLYDEVRTTRRVRMHRKIGQVLEERHAAKLEPHLAELAYHFCEAATGGDVGKAVEYAQLAARRALESVAYEDAAVHFDRALLALEADENPDEVLRCELLLSKADAHFRSGSGPLSSRSFEEAKTLAQQTGSALHVALSLIGLMRNPISASRADMAVVTELEQTIEALGEASPALRGRLYARIAGHVVWGDTDRAKEAARAALSLIGEDAALGARLEANIVRSNFLLGLQDDEERLDTATAMASSAAREGEPAVEFDSLLGACLYSMRLGRSDLTDQHIDRLEQLAAALRDPRSRGFVARVRAQRALQRGQLDEARTEAWNSWQTLRRLGSGDDPLGPIGQGFQSQIFCQRRLQGRLGETIEMLQSGVEAFPDAVIWRGLLACALAESGQTDRARELLDEVRRDGYAVVRSVLGEADTYTLLSEACLACEHSEAASELRELLLPTRGRFLLMNGVASFGTTDRALGNLEVVLGRFDDAQAHFEASMELERRTGSLGWLPRTQCDFARMLLTRNNAGDREMAFALLDEATSTAQELGLKGWLDRCIETRLAAQGIESGTLSIRSSIDVLAMSLGSRPPELSHHGAPDGTVTLVFSDIVGWTEMIERLGDHRAREVTRDHNRIVRELVESCGGHEVEIQGDAFLLAFSDPGAALRCAVGIQRALEMYGRDNPEPIRIRIGLHTGEALRDGDRFFGRTVNLAARVAAQADGGEILVSAAFAQCLDSADDVQLGSPRSVRLKGIQQAQQVRLVGWREGS
jgi:class 3 adenylate cyclase